ncbi:MAG: prepilin-type N-terminal cleavage/methylation domain-containing protein [Patescibacteria group bacterium]|nr:prepilin-type N-terminal cleavage/methylation domain-containing protein [Patescibacteria group bacterium]
MKRSGFTLIEFMVVMGFAALTASFITATLIRPQTQTDLAGETDKVIADIRGQQISAMDGLTSGTSDPVSYGIYFASTGYTLFRGSAYVPGAADNFAVSLPSSVQFTNITLPSSAIVFTRLTGDVSGYAAGSDSVTLQDTVSNATTTVTINRFGAITRTP